MNNKLAGRGWKILKLKTLSWKEHCKRDCILCKSLISMVTRVFPIQYSLLLSSLMIVTALYIPYRTRGVCVFACMLPVRIIGVKQKKLSTLLRIKNNRSKQKILEYLISPPPFFRNSLAFFLLFLRGKGIDSLKENNGFLLLLFLNIKLKGSILRESESYRG